MIRSAALSTSTGQEVFTAESGKHTRVFTVQKKNEHRCVSLLQSGKPCNRLLGKGNVTEYETVCPRCGATLLITKSGVKVIQTAKR